jgi:hypothetical protein
MPFNFIRGAIIASYWQIHRLLYSSQQCTLMKRFPCCIFASFGQILRVNPMSASVRPSRNLGYIYIFPAEQDFFLLHVVQTGSRAHPASYPMVTGGSFLVSKRPGREADHSPSSSAEVKNCGTIPPLPNTFS